MKMYKFALMVFFCYKVVEAEMPCSTANDLPVMDICATRSVIQDTNKHNILLKITSEQECQCELTIEDNNIPIEVQFKRFDDLVSSIPSGFPCGVIVKFAVMGDIFYQAVCSFNSIIYTVPAKNTLDIRTVHFEGALQPNEGYCIEIIKIKGDVILYISVGAGIIGSICLIIGAVVLARRLYYGKKTQEDTSHTGVNVTNDLVYDDLLHVPSSALDNSYQQLQLETRNQRKQTSIDIEHNTNRTTDYEISSGSNNEITNDIHFYINMNVKAKDNKIIYKTGNNKQRYICNKNGTSV